MNRCAPRLVVVLSLAFVAATAAAQTEEPRVQPTRAHSGAAKAAVSVVPQQLFGSLPVSTRSAEARQLVEKAMDDYENVMLPESLASARKAAAKDPKFALAYAMWSFAARRDVPAPLALAKANSPVVYVRHAQHRHVVAIHLQSIITSVPWYLLNIISKYPPN